MSGKAYGLQIVFDPKELVHASPAIWFDSYMKRYIENCTNSRQCGVGDPLGFMPGWSPHSAMMIFSNNGTSQVSFDFTKVFYEETVVARRTGTYKDHKMKFVSHSSIDYNPENDCSDSSKDNIRRDNLIWIYAKTEIVKQACGCYVCYDEPWFSWQVDRPCCTPKQVGRCLTSMVMYDSTCKANKENPYQQTYAGNLPAYVPVNVFMYPEKCDYGIIQNNSTLSTYWPKTGRYKSVVKPPCKYDLISIDNVEVREIKDSSLSDTELFIK